MNTDEVLQVRVKVVDGVLVPVDAVTLPSGHAYLARLEPLPETEGVDALAEIAAMAQPIGPADLARKFDF